ncbi:MAG: response regulator [Sedimenticola sp.]
MSSTQKILIVDDKRANLVALGQTLKELDAEVVWALNGEEALRATLNHDFALTILDVNMPEMDGFELADILRGDERTRYLPIIYLTAQRMDEFDISRGYEAGAVDYIVKPYDRTAMLSKVRIFLELDRQRRLLQKQLKAANQEMEAFTYSVSHDLRAPLRALSGFSTILVDEYGELLGKEGLEYLHYLQESVRDMSTLIDDLLRLSRSTRGEIHIKSINLSFMVTQMLKDLHKEEPERQVEFVVEPEIYAEADSGLMQRALENILGNAWKFTRDRSEVLVAFGKSRQDEDGRQVYFVRDNGAGFNMDYAEKLFKPFERLHRQDEFSGTGIGLATVQRIIRRHGGEIWGESEPDKGATFFFHLGRGCN